MSTVKANSHQVGQSVTAANNFTLYQPSTPDGTVRLGNGNSGSVTDLVTLTSAGNFGIGTSSPGSKLDVKSSGNTPIRLETTGGSDVYLQFTNTTGGAYIGSSGNGLGFYTSGSATLRMTLDSSGNLGLGVTPSYKLDVNGYLRVGGTSPNASGINVFNSQQYLYTTANWNYSNLNLIKPSTNTASPRFLSFMLDGDADSSTTIGGFPAIWGIYSGTPTTGSTSSGLSAKMGLAAYAGFNFYINGTQAMTLDASGNLLVGTTSVSAVGSKISVKGNTVVWGLGPTSGNDSFFVYNASSVGVYLGNGSTSWSSSSDERLKTDLKPIENAAQKVSTLRAMTGRFKTDDEGVSRSFLIAQDVQAVLPEAVDSENPDKLGVRYTETIPLLVAAIKELSAELNELKQKVNA